MKTATTYVALLLVLGCSDGSGTGDDGGGSGGEAGGSAGGSAGSGGSAGGSAGSGGSAGGGEDPLVERGRYLVNDVAMCSFCHTPRLPDGSPDQSRFLGGNPGFIDVDPDDPDFGRISPRNLSSHDPLGLGDATDDEIKDAFQNGIATNGDNLFPLMPYWVFHNMTDEDADAIVAYLRTVPPVDQEIPPNQEPFLEPSMPKEPIDTNMIPMPQGITDPAILESAMNGRYLSAQASLCVDCHSPEATPFMFDFDFTKMFAGGREFPAHDLGYQSPPYPEFIYTANLTQHETGILGYTVDDIVKVMREGIRPNGAGVCAPTHIGQASPFAGLTDQDVLDISRYIQALPGIDLAVPQECLVNGQPPPVP